jgi:hypothetical protein
MSVEDKVVKPVRDLCPINVKHSTHDRLVVYKISKRLKSMDAVVQDLLPKEVSV